MNVKAQPDKYYVIMDSIFYEYVLDDDVSPLVIGKINRQQEIHISRTNRKNRMFEAFPESLMHLGYDLFQAIDGPRLRDKISHGESIIENDDCIVIAHQLLHFVSLVVQIYDRGNLPAFQYESVHMSNFKLIKSYKVSCGILRDIFVNLKVPEPLSSCGKSFLTCRQPELESKNVKSFFRPFSENQIVKLLLKILEKFCNALDNFLLSCSEFFRLFVERKLSTKRRRTLNHIVVSLSNFHKGFQRILTVVYETFTSVQAIGNDKDDDECNKTIKFLKLVLKFSENLVKNFSANNRNFFVANEKTCEFLRLTGERKCLLKN